MPRLASITSQSLTVATAIDLILGQYELTGVSDDNVNSTEDNFVQGETVTLTFTGTYSGEGVTPPDLYWSIDDNNSNFVETSGQFTVNNTNNVSGTTVVEFVDSFTTAADIVNAGYYTLLVREGAQDGPAVASYYFAAANFVPPPGDWLDDNGDAVTVRSIISPIAMQVNGVFAVNPGVPFTVQGTASLAVTTITNISANTGTILEIEDDGNSTSFIINEEFTILSSGRYDTFSLDAVSYNEGDLVTVTVETTNLIANSQVDYTISGVQGQAQTSGTISIDQNGTGTDTFTVTADDFTEAAQTLTVTLASIDNNDIPTGDLSDTATVNDATDNVPEFEPWISDTGFSVTVNDLPSATTLTIEGTFNTTPDVPVGIRGIGTGTITGVSAISGSGSAWTLTVDDSSGFRERDIQRAGEALEFAPLGYDAVTNGTFDTDTTGWTTSGDGTAVYDSEDRTVTIASDQSTEDLFFYQELTLQPGYYQPFIELVSETGQGPILQMTNVTTDSNILISAISDPGFTILDNSVLESGLTFAYPTTVRVGATLQFTGTAVINRIGLLRKSALAYTNLLTNGNFSSTDLSAYTIDSNITATVTNNQLVVDGTGYGFIGLVEQTFNTVPGQTYDWTAEIVSSDLSIGGRGGYIEIRNTGSFSREVFLNDAVVAGSGVQSGTFTADNTTAFIRIATRNGETNGVAPGGRITVDNLSVTSSQ